MSITDEIKSVIDSEYYKNDKLIQSYAKAWEWYKDLIATGVATPKERVLPNISESILLRRKVEFNCNIQ